MSKRKDFPKRLRMDYFLVDFPVVVESFEDEELDEGLPEIEGEEKEEPSNKLIVRAVGEDCSLKVNDDLLLPYAQGLKIVLEHGDYMLLRERDVVGVW